jgi:N,N'-diacetyllegionaminate synthase
MKKYALVIGLPEIIQKGSDTLVNEIIDKFDIPSIKLYPTHIPIKYGFHYEDEEKLKETVINFNKTVNHININVEGAKDDGILFHLSVTKNQLLKELQSKLHKILKEELNVEDFKEKEVQEDYKFHFTLAENNIDENKKSEIKEFLKTKKLEMSFPISKIGIIVKEGDGFVKLHLEEEKKMSVYEKIKNSKTPFIIAEIGSNHNGDIEKAKQLIDIAVETGCNAVKFQSFDYNSLFPQTILNEHKEMVAEDVDAVGLEAIQRKLALSWEDHIELKRYCDEKRIIFCSTPLSEKHVDWLDNLNVEFFKVASLDIVNLPLLRKIAQKGKPIVISTGMAVLSEIERALETVYSEGNNEVVLLHCNASYPPKYNDINLRNIPMLRKTFNIPIGFSDHSKNTAIPAAAVTLGACVIEKHIMLNNLHCRDEAVSLTPEELRIMVNDIHNISKALGSGKKNLTEDEKARRVAVFGRRSILVNRPMQLGETINEQDLIFKRPGTGISVDKLQYVVGRKLNKSKNVEEQILWEDLE